MELTKELIEENAAKVAALNLQGVWFASISYKEAPPQTLLDMHEAYGGDVGTGYKALRWSGRINDVLVSVECDSPRATATPSALDLLRASVAQSEQP